MTTKHDPRPNDRSDDSWLNRPRTVTRIYHGVWAVCGASVLAQLFVHIHGHLWWEELFGFHGVYAFVGCVFLVLAARQMRKILLRGEDYYD